MLKKLLLSTILLSSMLFFGAAYARVNPVVEYPSQTLAERAVKFPALTVSIKTSATLKRASVISDMLIELEYKDDKDRTIIIRTAKYKKNNPNISGIYTDKWYAENIGSLYMHIAHLENRLSASYWNDEKYAYAIIVKDVDKNDFLSIAAPIYEGINPPM